MIHVSGFNLGQLNKSKKTGAFSPNPICLVGLSRPILILFKMLFQCIFFTKNLGWVDRSDGLDYKYHILIDIGLVSPVRFCVLATVQFNNQSGEREDIQYLMSKMVFVELSNKIEVELSSYFTHSNKYWMLIHYDCTHNNQNQLNPEITLNHNCWLALNKKKRKNECMGSKSTKRNVRR